tara:strand:+ start:3217 stop:3621 length:405 start_codon:yes stop_codon:yes gene_type:complete
VAESLLLEEELREEKLSLLNNMVKLTSLKKNDHFKKALKEKKIHSDFFSLFAAKNFINKTSGELIISFVMKKKIGNAVKRNKIKRKLKAIVIKISKIRGAIDLNYTYIVFGKTKAYFAKHERLLEEMTKVFKKI